MICKKCNQDVMATLYGLCLECYDLTPPDPIVIDVIDKFRERSTNGILKYGTTLDSNKLELKAWINHTMEELMDATLYLMKIYRELEEKEEDLHFKLSEQGYFDNSNDEHEPS